MPTEYEYHGFGRYEMNLVPTPGSIWRLRGDPSVTWRILAYNPRTRTFSGVYLSGHDTAALNKTYHNIPILRMEPCEDEFVQWVREVRSGRV